MFLKKQIRVGWYVVIIAGFFLAGSAHAESGSPQKNNYAVGRLKPIDSIPILKIGRYHLDSKQLQPAEPSFLTK